ncbi:Coactosin-like protein [Balamuthia mandrillaris]
MAEQLVQVKVVDAREIGQALTALNSHDDPTNWVLMGYGQGINDIVFVGKGSGGLSEFKEQMQDDKIFFAVLEVVVKGDEYNPVKHVFFSWIGNQVPPGVMKARSSGHRTELVEWVKKFVSVSCEYQTEKRTDIHYDPIAQAITRMRATYHTSHEPTQERQAMSRSSAQGGGSTSKLVIVDKAKVVAGLKEVYEAKADWAILAYVEGKKDEVELVGTGSGGVEGLRNQFPTNRIYFCVLSLDYHAQGTRDTITKYCFVTLIGPEVKPLQKARSGGQRQDIWDFVLSVMPLHAHYQPGSARDLTAEEILVKFRD